jgi:hypothetical protein
MAIRVQTKSDESNSRISKLEEELNSYKNRVQVRIINGFRVHYHEIRIQVQTINKLGSLFIIGVKDLILKLHVIETQRRDDQK